MTKLARELAQLPREMNPGVDLWPAIAARLKAPPQRWTLPRMAAAAGVFLVATVALRIGSETPPVFTSQGNLQVLSASAELEYSGALRDLANSIGFVDQSAAGNEVIADYEASLAVVHLATDQVREALLVDPESRLLTDMLAQLQKKQLGVLREIALVAESNRGKAT